MKNYFYGLCLLIACSCAFVSCSDDDDTLATISATLKFDVPSEIAQYEPNVAVESLTLKETNTGLVTTVVAPATRSGNGTTITVNVPEGLYTIDMDASVSYRMNGQMNYTKMRAHKESVELTAMTMTTPVSVEGFIYNASSENGGFVISEIFFTGTTTPEGKQYNGDKYIRLYNNSGDTLCADGLTIAESEFLTVQKENYTPNIMNQAFSAGAIYRIPLGGNLMVAPGESVLLCDNGINHKEANSNSFDLTKADFEWYDKSSNPRFEDIDSKVPNMEKIYCYTATIWGPHNRGFKSFVLARLGDNEKNQLSAEEYLEKYSYEYSYDMIIDGTVYPMGPKTSFKIPNEWILDAVNLSVESEYVWTLTSPALDKGWTSCGKVNGDMTRYGKSVRRKVLSGKTLQDTNDSSVDFLRDQPADPYFKFHE